MCWLSARCWRQPLPEAVRPLQSNVRNITIANSRVAGRAASGYELRARGRGRVGSTLPICWRLRWRRDLHGLSKFGSTPQLSSRASLPLMCCATDRLSTPAPAAAQLSVHACHPRYSVRVHPAESASHLHQATKQFDCVNTDQTAAFQHVLGRLKSHERTPRFDLMLGCISLHDGRHPPLASPDPPDKGELLLYYCYIDLRAAQSEVCDWMRSNCTSLGLVGRVRVARDGISATIGGTAAAIAEHIAAVQAHPLLGGQRTDFKVAPWPRDCSAKAAAEAGFNTLAVAACKEVVALGQTVCDVDSLSELAGAHVSPQNFDAMLADPAGRSVLVDARNVYESRIGRFEAVSSQA